MIVNRKGQRFADLFLLIDIELSSVCLRSAL
ncbi:hypothetical protein PEPS_10590 [Persicobacter psychrovividus]|uniref:Uncharacterized protein n=1 Tax=Persicobacter psychrovividus TaxID=387638 RepID=A0ABN6L7I5_9BACT|nr:hypothetical protein PEPS_10590 [Persicobacter psychrovividus]